MIASDASVNYYKELYRVAREQQDAKTAFEADTLAVQAELARRQSVGTTLRHQLATLKQRLGITAGREIDAELPFAAVDGVPQLEVDIASAQARAATQRPEIREAQFKVQQAQQGVTAKRYERIPDVSLTTRFIGLNNIEVLPPTVAAVGLQMTWNLFDWGRKGSEIFASERVRTQAEISRRDPGSGPTRRRRKLPAVAGSARADWRRRAREKSGRPAVAADTCTLRRTVGTP